MKKEQFKEVTKRVNFKIFPYKAVIVISNDVQQSFHNRKHIFGPAPERTINAGAISVGTSGGSGFIFLHCNAAVGVVAHEAYHCVRRVLDFIGAEHDEEVEAYLLTFVTDNIVEAVKKYDA